MSKLVLGEFSDDIKIMATFWKVYQNLEAIADPECRYVSFYVATQCVHVISLLCKVY